MRQKKRFLQIHPERFSYEGALDKSNSKQKSKFKCSNIAIHKKTGKFQRLHVTDTGHGIGGNEDLILIILRQLIINK